MTRANPFGRDARVVQCRFNVNFEMPKQMGRIHVALEAAKAGKERVCGQNPFRSHFGEFRRWQGLCRANPGQAGTPSPREGLAGKARAKKFSLQAFETRLSILCHRLGANTPGMAGRVPVHRTVTVRCTGREPCSGVGG